MSLIALATASVSEADRTVTSLATVTFFLVATAVTAALAIRSPPTHAKM